ncbi:MAG: response regulator [Verrucomicrobiota bacterium]
MGIDTTAANYVPRLTTKKLLLLEDDRFFGEFLREYLVSQGYTVTLVPNGADGVREILQSDFDVIVCDMLMPKLPGNMFYLAVQRTKPHLCKRFLFITGHSADPKIGAFIAEVGGVLLAKPFRVEDISRALRRIEARS